MEGIEKQHSGSRLTLRLDSGLSIGQIILLHAGRSTLGRSVDAEIPVDDSRVSRAHASIHELNGEFFISDLGSTNGTFHNGVFIHESKKLGLGDQIRVGSTVYCVESLDTSRMSALPAWRETTRAIRLPESLKKFKSRQGTNDALPSLSQKAESFLSQELGSTLEELVASTKRQVAKLFSPQGRFAKSKARWTILVLSGSLVLLAILSGLL